MKIELSNSKRSSALLQPRGFTLVEMIVVIVIIGVLAAVIGPRIFHRIGESKQATAAANAATFANAVTMYQADMGSLPDPSNLTVLAARPATPEAKGPWLQNAQQLMDPWGRPFELKIPGVKNFDFDVISLGADKQVGGTGENADVVKP